MSYDDRGRDGRDRGYDDRDRGRGYDDRDRGRGYDDRDRGRRDYDDDRRRRDYDDRGRDRDRDRDRDRERDYDRRPRRSGFMDAPPDGASIMPGQAGMPQPGMMMPGFGGLPMNAFRPNLPASASAVPGVNPKKQRELYVGNVRARALQHARSPHTHTSHTRTRTRTRTRRHCYYCAPRLHPRLSH